MKFKSYMDKDGSYHSVSIGSDNEQEEIGGAVEKDKDGRVYGEVGGHVGKKGATVQAAFNPKKRTAGFYAQLGKKKIMLGKMN